MLWAPVWPGAAALPGLLFPELPDAGPSSVQEPLLCREWQEASREGRVFLLSL